MRNDVYERMKHFVMEDIKPNYAAVARQFEVDPRTVKAAYVHTGYKAIFAPVFQSCVVNYVNELLRFHNRDVSNYLNRSSLTLTTNIKELSNEQIKAKYPDEIAQKLIFTKNDIDVTKK